MVELLAIGKTKPQWQIEIRYFSSLFIYYLIKIIIDYGKISALCLLAFLFILCNAMSGFFSYIADIAMAKVRINLVHNLRLALFRKSIDLPVQYFTNTKK